MESIVLSIMILTRNRKWNVLKTLQSCVECTLPGKTEFVIVDNASQDGTRDAVERFFQTKSFEYQYHFLSENVGAAAGRNEGFQQARGRYIYFMDDDAYIAGPKEYFFEKMINFLKDNKDIFCITTSIYDTAFKGNRLVIVSKECWHSIYKRVLMFHGGSFLVDSQRCFDQKRLFLEHHFWGMEELYPSLKSYFNGYYVVEMNDLNIIHDPDRNSRIDRKKRIILHYVGATCVKLIFFPLIVHPIIFLMFSLRIIKHSGVKALIEAFRQLSHLKSKNGALLQDTVSMNMFLRLVREFGFVATC